MGCKDTGENGNKSKTATLAGTGRALGSRGVINTVSCTRANAINFSASDREALAESSVVLINKHEAR